MGQGAWTMELLFDGLEPDGGDKGDGYGGHALDLDDHAFVTLDALNDAFGILEVAIGDAHALAGGLQIIGIGVEVIEAIVLNGGHADEVVHLTFGNREEVIVVAMGKGVGDVAQRMTGLIVHLQLGDALLGGIDKDEIANGGLKVFVGLAGVVDPAAQALHGEKGAHT